MKNTISILVLLFVLALARGSPTHLQEPTAVTVNIEQVTDGLYLDNTIIPVGYERDMLIRLYNFLRVYVVPDSRTPFPEYANQLPVILRYVSLTEDGQFPYTTEGFAGWCDVVFVECTAPFEGDCVISMSANSASQERAFLALVAVPKQDNPDYLMQLWGITAHEIAHAFGAIDGPGCPYYDDEHLIAPVEPASDTYYWFGIAGWFKSGWQGIIVDAWYNRCTDALCNALRDEVFQFQLS